MTSNNKDHMPWSLYDCLGWPALYTSQGLWVFICGVCRTVQVSPVMNGILLASSVFPHVAVYAPLHSQKASQAAQNVLAGHMWPAGRMFETLVYSSKLAKLYTTIDNALKVRKKTFIFYYVHVICTTNWRHRTNTGLYEPLSSIRLNCQLWRSSKWSTYCKRRCAAALAHAQDRHIKKRNGRLVMHQEVSSINQVEIGQCWNVAQKAN